jgi:glucose/arabinose dehydrogenase
MKRLSRNCALRQRHRHRAALGAMAAGLLACAAPAIASQSWRDGLSGDVGSGTGRFQVVAQAGRPRPPPPAAPSPARLVPVVSGLARPIAIEHAGDARLFIAEQAGRIRVLNPDRTLRTLPLLDITDRVYDVNNEQGLLGLAFDPDYANNRRFYVNYIFHPGGLDRTRISRFTADPGGNTASAASELVLMEFSQPFVNHNGGDMHFGPDGYLYIASGDGGGSGDPQNNAQNPSTPLGKLLRIDVNGAGGAPDCNLVAANHYGTPSGNAYNDGDGGAGCDEIFASGLRNPWRFGFDRATGDLWIADVGQDSFEEVDFVPAGTGAGLNFGWRCREGGSPFNPAGCTGTYFEPLLSLAQASGYCSITGGRVYRGVREPALVGRYFFTDLCSSAIRTITRDAGQVAVAIAVPAGQVSQPVTFGEDVDGELHVAGLGGTLYRIRSSARTAVTQFTVSTPDNDCLDLSGGTIGTGTPVIAPPCNLRTRPRWQLRDDGSLFSHAARRCLGVPNANPVPGAVQLVLQDCNSSAAQRFTPTGANQLKSIAGLCVEESLGTPDRVQLGTCNGGQHQRWFFNAAAP